MLPPYERAFLEALGLTIAIELPVVWVGVKCAMRSGAAAPSGRSPSPGRIVLAGLGASAATLPYLWFVFPLFFAVTGPPLWAAEAAIGVVEAVVFRLVLALEWRWCLGLSVLANGLSWGLGAALRFR